jgi:hypothetical protein
MTQPKPLIPWPPKGVREPVTGDQVDEQGKWSSSHRARLEADPGADTPKPFYIGKRAKRYWSDEWDAWFERQPRERGAPKPPSTSAEQPAAAPPPASPQPSMLGHNGGPPLDEPPPAKKKRRAKRRRKPSRRSSAPAPPASATE